MSAPKYWQVDPPNREYNLAYICTPENGYKPGFETTEYARALSQKLINRHKTTSRSCGEYASELEDCLDGEEPCENYCCPICGREYRRWLASQLLPIANNKTRPMQIMTAYLGQAKRGRLGSLDIKRISANFYTKLTRLGFRKCHILGGIEVNFNPIRKRWILHCHLLVIGECTDAIMKLRRSLKEKKIKRAVKAQALKNDVIQIAYLLKFQTYYRITKNSGKKRGKAFMLKKSELSELVDWTKHYEFGDFLFLYGAKRNGSHINLYLSGIKQ